MAALLQHEELCACQLTELLGVAGATASRHLGQLQSAGLIESRKKGRWVFFSLKTGLPGDLPLSWLQEQLSQSEIIAGDREHLQAILMENPETICRRQRGEKCVQEKT